MLSVRYQCKILQNVISPVDMGRTNSLPCLFWLWWKKNKDSGQCHCKYVPSHSIMQIKLSTHINKIKLCIKIRNATDVTVEIKGQDPRMSYVCQVWWLRGKLLWLGLGIKRTTGDKAIYQSLFFFPIQRSYEQFRTCLAPGFQYLIENTTGGENKIDPTSFNFSQIIKKTSP